MIQDKHYPAETLGEAKREAYLFTIDSRPTFLYPVQGLHDLIEVWQNPIFAKTAFNSSYELESPCTMQLSVKCPALPNQKLEVTVACLCGQAMPNSLPSICCMGSIH